MPTCYNCGFSQNVGEFTQGLCDNCRPLRIEIGNYQREEIVLNNQITQKTNELTQAQELNTKLQQDNRDLLNDIHQYKQKITTLENQLKTQTETLKNTEKELTQLQTQYQNHLHQEKAQLTKEIQLIKEVIQ